MMEFDKLTTLIENQFKKLLEPFGWSVRVRPYQDPRLNKDADQIGFMFTLKYKDKVLGVPLNWMLESLKHAWHGSEEEYKKLTKNNAKHIMHCAMDAIDKAEDASEASIEFDKEQAKDCSSLEMQWHQNDWREKDGNQQ